MSNTINGAAPQSAYSGDYFDQSVSDMEGDPQLQMAAMMLKHARETRKGNDQQRSLEEKNIQSAEKQQLQQMRAEAKKIRKAAKKRAVGQIANGAFTAASGAVTLTGAGMHAGKGTDAYGKAMDGYKGSATTLQGIGGTAEGYTGLEAIDIDDKASEHRRNATAAEHRADASKRRLDKIDEADGASKDLKDAALDHMRNVTRTQNDTDQAAIYLRG